MKYIGWTAVVLFLAYVLILFVRGMAGDPNEIISGKVRFDFVQSSSEGCIMELIENPDFNETPPETIASYCSCSANATADQLTNSEVKEMARRGTLSPEIQERLLPAIESCREILTQ